MADEVENTVSPKQGADIISCALSAYTTPPTILKDALLQGKSYTYFSAVPPYLRAPVKDSSETTTTDKLEAENTSDETESSELGIPCCLGIDEAGRGPVLGPMVYGTFYLPISLHRSLLADTHGFDDSKVLKPEFRAQLMEKICTPPPPTSTDESSTTTSVPDLTCLYTNCGYGVSFLSAPSISAAMQAPTPYNLNAQAVDATVHLIQTVINQGVNVREIYIDTIGQPGPYQKRLERVFPGRKVRVEKKADSLFPVVSAASVVAKVSRDVGLEEMWEGLYGEESKEEEGEEEKEDEEVLKDTSSGTLNRKRKADDASKDAPVSKAQKKSSDSSPATKSEPAWGSGYPSDARCSSWLKANIDPLFGWGAECRFSWGTAKDLLEKKELAVQVEWPEGDDEGGKLTDWFWSKGEDGREKDELASWWGESVSTRAF